MLNIFHTVNFIQSISCCDKPNKAASPALNSTRNCQHSRKGKYTNWCGLSLGSSDGYFFFQEYKAFQLISRLKGAALCDIKKQYIKKKKNPE